MFKKNIIKDSENQKTMYVQFKFEGNFTIKFLNVFIACCLIGGCCAMVAGVYLNSFMFAAALAGITCLVLTYMNPEKIIYIYIFSYSFSPTFLGIDLGADLPLITFARGFLMYFILFEMVFNWDIILYNLKRLKYIKLNKLVILFLIVHTIVLFKDINPESIKKYTRILVEYVFLIYFLVLRVKDKKELDKCVDVFLFSAFIICLFGIYEFISLENVFTNLGGSRAEFEMIANTSFIRSGLRRVYGPFTHPLAYGLYLAILLPIGIVKFMDEKDKVKKILYLIASAFLLLNLFLTMSRGPILYFFASLFVYIITLDKQKRNTFLKIALILVLVIAILLVTGLIPESVSKGVYSLFASLVGNVDADDFGGNDDAIMPRLRQYAVAWREIEKSPLIGNGLAYLRTTKLYDFYYKLFPYKPYVIKTIDNYYLIKLMETGFLGLITQMMLILAIVIQCLINLYKKVNLTFSRIMIFIMLYYHVSMVSVDELNTIKYLCLVMAFYMCSELFEKHPVESDITGIKRFKRN